MRLASGGDRSARRARVDEMRALLPPASDYCRGFVAARLRVRGCDEPRLTPEAAVTVAAERLPDANRAAFVGLPGVIVWDLDKAPQPL